MYRQNSLKIFLPLFLFVAVALLAFSEQSLAANPKLGNMTLDSKIESMKKAGVKPVVFPHTSHEEIIKCKTCHNSIFKDKRGANDISMKKNMNKEACGSANCHNSAKAFPLYQCAKCHSKR